MALIGPRTRSYTNATGARYNFNRLPVADFVNLQYPAVRDDYFKFTTLLLTGDGTNGAQNNTFLDSSTANAGIGFNITRNGDTTQGTFTPFSQTGWSNYFNSGTPDYLSLPFDSINVGANDFTAEAWVYVLDRSAIYTVFNGQTNASTAGGSSYGMTIQDTTGYLQAAWYVGGGTYTVTGANAVTLNSWNHVAFSRTAGNVSIFLNGIREATRSDMGTSVINDGSATYNPYIGRNGAFYPMKGYISNFRLIRGNNGYNATSSTITVPTSPLTAVANTLVLACQSNRFLDANTTPKTITVSGSPSVQAFSPFAPTDAYSAAAIGGSGYFDGTGDYLSLSNAGLEPTGTSDFTYETWVYNNGYSGSQYGRGIITLFTPASYGNNRLLIRLNSGANVINFYLVVGGSVLAGMSGTDGTVLLTQNAWSHLAVVRRNGVFTVYINGVQDINITNLTTVSLTGFAALEIGRNQDGTTPDFFGYMSNFRYIKSQALTSGAFRPPTALVTSTAVGWTGANVASSITGNVSLLCNFTNAGITDTTAKNVLETEGGAQISTAQSKFGSSSMYFDGTGDQLILPASENFEFGSGNFTVECWVYITGTSGSIINYSNGQTSNSNFCWELYQSSSSAIQMTIVEGSTVYSASSSSFTLNAWNHVAGVRNGNTLTIYVNGTAGGTTASVTNVSITRRSGVTAKVSGYNNATGMITGYIDDLRITKGIARYTANFPTPVAAFPSQ
jgi:hypothetical protein